MTSQRCEPAVAVEVAGEPVMVAVLGEVAADTALRDAFVEAERRGVAVRVVASGPASPAEDDLLRDLVDRWAEKFPDVPVTVSIRRLVDAGVTLVAATRWCAVAFVPQTPDPASAAVLQAMIRRAHCPVIVVGAPDLNHHGAAHLTSTTATGGALT